MKILLNAIILLIVNVSFIEAFTCTQKDGVIKINNNERFMVNSVYIEDWKMKCEDIVGYYQGFKEKKIKEINVTHNIIESRVLISLIEKRKNKAVFLKINAKKIFNSDQYPKYKSLIEKLESKSMMYNLYFDEYKKEYYYMTKWIKKDNAYKYSPIEDIKSVTISNKTSSNFKLSKIFKTSWWNKDMDLAKNKEQKILLSKKFKDDLKDEVKDFLTITKKDGKWEIKQEEISFKYKLPKIENMINHESEIGKKKIGTQIKITNLYDYIKYFKHWKNSTPKKNQKLNKDKKFVILDKNFNYKVISYKNKTFTLELRYSKLKKITLEAYTKKSIYKKDIKDSSLKLSVIYKKKIYPLSFSYINNPTVEIKKEQNTQEPKKFKLITKSIDLKGNNPDKKITLEPEYTATREIKNKTGKSLSLKKIFKNLSWIDSNPNETIEADSNITVKIKKEPIIIVKDRLKKFIKVSKKNNKIEIEFNKIYYVVNKPIPVKNSFKNIKLFNTDPIDFMKKYLIDTIDLYEKISLFKQKNVDGIDLSNLTYSNNQFTIKTKYSKIKEINILCEGREFESFGGGFSGKVDKYDDTKTNLQIEQSNIKCGSKEKFNIYNLNNYLKKAISNNKEFPNPKCEYINNEIKCLSSNLKLLLAYLPYSSNYFISRAGGDQNNIENIYRNIERNLRNFNESEKYNRLLVKTTKKEANALKKDKYLPEDIPIDIADTEDASFDETIDESIRKLFKYKGDIALIYFSKLKKNDIYNSFCKSSFNNKVVLINFFREDHFSEKECCSEKAKSFNKDNFAIKVITITNNYFTAEDLKDKLDSTVESVKEFLELGDK